jgi:hypothetical protein
MYIYIYIYIIFYRTQVSNSKGDHDTVLHFNNTHFYSVISSCLGSAVLVRSRSYLNIVQSVRCTEVLECESAVRGTGFISTFNRRVVDGGHEQFFKFTFPPARNFLVSRIRLRKTNLCIIALFICCFSRQKFGQVPRYTIGT